LRGGLNLDLSRMSRKHNAWPWPFAAIIVTVAVVVIGAGWKEPSYKGKSLTRWLQQCYDASLEETQKIAQAHQAINAIGAEKALPVLMEMIKAEDGKVRSWIIQKNERWNIKGLKMREAIETRQLGVAGFEALGTNAAPAVEKLTTMLADTNRGPGSLALIALRGLIYIGMPAEKSVCRALTNQNPEIRAFATSQIGWVSNDIELYLKRLEGPLRDSDTTVRFAAVQGLGLQTKYPEEVLPLLIRAMSDPAQNVAGYAVRFVGDLGTNGIKALEPLKEIVETGNSYMATHALRSLTSVAPDRALPMVFAWLDSTNQDHRARAALMLAEFLTTTPVMLDRLKRATRDPNAKVAHSATEALKKLRQKEKEHGSYEVVIAGEPTYGGKGLGDWLKRKPGQEEVSQETKRAVQAIGTKAIPALLARLVYVDDKYGLYDYDTSLESVGGFALLGEQALPALPRLVELINGEDERIALFALISCCNMGSNAVRVVASGLTNDFAEVRGEALHFLTEGPLTAFPEARKCAVPDIIAMLRDPEESIRMNATNVLLEIDPVAAGKAGVKATVRRDK
jgi:HEAT repeat protein